MSYTDSVLLIIMLYLIEAVLVLPLWDTTEAGTNKPPFAHKAPELRS